MQGAGYAYIDNVRTSTTATKTSATVDLTNTLSIEEAWQATDDTTFDHYYANSLILKNIDEQKTIVQNKFAYNLTSNEYYEIIVEACSVDWIIHSTKAPEVGSVVGMTFTPQDIHIMHRDPEDAPAPQETVRTPDDSADTH